MDRGDWREAAARLELALAAIDENRIHDYITCLQAFAGAARLSLYHNDLTVQRWLTWAMRARPSATYTLPFVAVRLRLHLAKTYLALADRATAGRLLHEIDDILDHRPALGALTGEVDEFRRVLASSASTGAIGGSPLTPAELRLLPYLQTHLTTDRIAGRLFVSSHTVKTRRNRSTASWASPPATTQYNVQRQSACSARSRRHSRDNAGRPALTHMRVMRRSLYRPDDRARDLPPAQDAIEIPGGKERYGSDSQIP